MAHTNFRQRVKNEEPTHIQKITEIAGNIAHAAVIKEGDIFFLSQPDGDVPLNNESGLGFYYHDCRYLNGYELRIDAKVMTSLLTSAFYGSMAKLQFTNPDLGPPGMIVAKQQIGISCRRIVDSKALALHDTFTCRNFGCRPARFTLNFSFSSAFEDVFQIRGAKPENRGKLYTPQWKGGSLQFRYDGADGIHRSLALVFQPHSNPAQNAAAAFDIFLQPGESKCVQVSLAITESQRKQKAKTSAPGSSQVVRIAQTCHEDFENSVSKYTNVRSNSSLVNHALRRSLRDLRTLQSVLHGQKFFWPACHGMAHCLEEIA